MISRKFHSLFSEEIKRKTDSEIVNLAKKNPDYFAILIERYKDSLFFFVKRISYFGKEDIEDILQEVFIKVYKNLNDYEDSLKFSSWIYRITRNQTIDEIRKRGSRPKTTSLEDNELVKFIKSGQNIEKEFLRKENLNLLRKSIENLPQKYREVLVLRFLEEKNYEEIMDIIKKPKGTVASLIRRGRSLLSEYLEKNSF